MRADQGSTRDTALAYDGDAMRTQTILLPILLPILLLLADGVACKDDEPSGAEFGEPCGYDPETDKTAYCADGLDCYVGYCEEKCQDDSDCQPIEGYAHQCSGGLCHIVCDKTMSCPQTLATSLECNMIWCAAIDGA